MMFVNNEPVPASNESMHSDANGKSHCIATPAAVADAGKVRVGAGLRLRPAPVADLGKVRVGAGLRRG